MRKILFLLLFISCALNYSAQAEVPLSWEKSVEVNEDSTISLIFKANIDEGWHLYSQNLASDEGPIATSFSFQEAPGYAKVGETLEGESVTKFDPNFEMDIAMFDSSATFIQKITHEGASLRLFGQITYMVCNDEQCIFPPEEEFTFVYTGSQYIFVDPKNSDD